MASKGGCVCQPDSCACGRRKYCKRARAVVETPNTSAKRQKTGITLYTSATPNGWKVSILLEELGIPYDVSVVRLHCRQQKEEWFLKLNPNGRIPVIVDHDNNDFPVFESGAILIYLAEKYRKFLPQQWDLRSETLQWLMFQMGGVGPMQGQAHYFLHYTRDTIPFAIERYQQETRRLYEAMNRRLTGRKWLAANQYTIADIACFSWLHLHGWAGVPLKGLDALKSWMKKIKERPAVQKGLNVPVRNMFRCMLDKDECRKRFIAKMRAMNNDRDSGISLSESDLCDMCGSCECVGECRKRKKENASLATEKETKKETNTEEEPVVEKGSAVEEKT